MLQEDKHERRLRAQARIVGGPALEEAAQSFPLGDVSCACKWAAVFAAAAIHVRLDNIHRRSDGGCCKACNWNDIQSNVYSSLP